MKELFLLELHSLPIFKQLQIEEALLRCETKNFCIINTNASPSIVMGISGKKEKLIDTTLAKRDQIPVIKRFSGGGTVYTDEETIFVSFICNTCDFPFSPYPQEILQWSESFYKPLFPSQFHLRENDFVIERKKIGGNAQYLKKDRWLLHTSFLWHYSKEKMQYLLLPEKRPLYREDRDHENFLTALSSHFHCKKSWLESLRKHILSIFNGKTLSLSDIEKTKFPAHRQATEIIPL